MFLVEKDDDSSKSIKKSNPSLFSWKKIDQFLVSWLLSTISESMFRHVAKCIIVYKIYNILELHFQSVFRARTLHLRNLLRTTKKDSLSISDYVLRMKELGDELVASGVNISDEESLLYILEFVVGNLTSSSSQTILQEAQILLHKHEMRLERQNSSFVNFQDQIALMASKQNFNDSVLGS